MTERPLFDDLPEQAMPEKPLGKPRLLVRVRDQWMRSMDIDSLIGEDQRRD